MQGFLSPEKVLRELKLQSNMVAAEFGCGSGAFAIALAKKLSNGRVYALDVQEQVLSALKGRVRAERVLNVEMVHCDLEQEHGSTLPDDFLDLVLIPNMLFQAENKGAVIKEANRILKKQGQLLIIDWAKQKGLAPKTGMILPSQVKAIAEELGLKFKKEFDAGNFHYGLLFEKG